MGKTSLLGLHYKIQKRKQPCRLAASLLAKTKAHYCFTKTLCLRLTQVRGAPQGAGCLEKKDKTPRRLRRHPSKIVEGNLPFYQKTDS